LFNVFNGSIGVVFSASDNVARRCATGGRLGMMLIDNVNMQCKIEIPTISLVSSATSDIVDSRAGVGTWRAHFEG
jgi:hypothetical protein